MQTLMHSDSLSPTNTHTYTYTHTHIHTHAQAHTHNCSYTYTHTHTHTHTHTQHIYKQTHQTLKVFASFFDDIQHIPNYFTEGLYSNEKYIILVHVFFKSHCLLHSLISKHTHTHTLANTNIHSHINTNKNTSKHTQIYSLKQTKFVLLQVFKFVH